MHLADVETDGFLENVSVIHCLGIYDFNTDTYTMYNDSTKDTPSIEEGLEVLSKSDCVIGHNWDEYDDPVIRKLYPDWKPPVKTLDTLVMSKLMYPDMKDRDFRFRKKNPEFPGNLIGTHKLEAWGARLGCPKDDYSKRMKELGIDPWAQWNQDMEDYCLQDIKTNVKLWHQLMAQGFSEMSIDIEHKFRRIIKRQEDNGWQFNEAKAGQLYAKLGGIRDRLTTELQAAFGMLYKRDGKPVCPKRSQRRKPLVDGLPREEMTEGAEYCKVKLTDFNPGSRQQIAMVLMRRYGWKPKEFGSDGWPTVDDAIVKKLPYKEAPLLAKYLLVAKRIGQLAEGEKAWLKYVKGNGRIYGRVNTMGTVTGRCSHFNPNMAQVPASKSPFGSECRELFEARKGYKLVGCDADGLELRMLAGYMAKYDGGAYAEAVDKGDKEKGTDAHTLNMKALEIYSRDDAKTFLYAYIYGAQAPTLGRNIIESLVKTGHLPKKRYAKQDYANAGNAALAKIEQRVPALDRLLSAAKKATKARGYLRGIDGRKIYTRSEHSCLNTLLQGGGAVVMKLALIILDEWLQERDYIDTDKVMFVGNIHDEFQMEVVPELAEEVGALAAEAITKAGEKLEFGCILRGNYDIGDTWADTH